MPYQVHYHDGIAEIKFFGCLTPKDIDQVNLEVLTHENAPGIAKRFIVLDEVTDFEINYSTMLPLVIFRKQQNVHKEAKTALLAIRPIELGLARMWQTLIDDCGIKCMIFESREDAMNWLTQE